MPEFPSEERLLGELVSTQADTIERQCTQSRLLVEFAKSHGLGNITPLPFPPTAAFGQQKPRRYNLMIDIPPPGGGQPEETLGLYAHFDVVPPSEGYTRKPNQLVRDRHNSHMWYGLGSNDMLIGNVAILFALKEIIDKNLLWNRRAIRAIFVCGEEAWSEGFHAAKTSGAFNGVSCVLTPETVAQESLQRTDTRLLNIGRPGRYKLIVTAKGLEKHVGGVEEPQDTPLLARTMNHILWSVAHDLQQTLQPNPDQTGDLILRPKCEPDNWGARKKPSLTTPYATFLELSVHYAHHYDSPERIGEWVRERCIELAQKELRLSETVCEEIFQVELETHGPDPNTTTPFTQPWKENYYHKFLRDVRERLIPQANAACDARRYPEGLPTSIRTIVDSAVADCGLIANLGIPVAGIVPMGWGAHRPDERVDIRSREYVTNVIIGAAGTTHILAPSNGSI